MSDPNATNPDIIERLTRMETKLDFSLVQWNEGFKDHEQRIRAVENTVTSASAVNRWKATTGVAVALGLLGIIGQVVQVLMG